MSAVITGHAAPFTAAYDGAIKIATTAHDLIGKHLSRDEINTLKAAVRSMDKELRSATKSTENPLLGLPPTVSLELNKARQAAAPLNATFDEAHLGSNLTKIEDAAKQVADHIVAAADAWPSDVPR